MAHVLNLRHSSGTLMTQPQLIVGLQNPGSAYEKTRHNAGAWFIQEYARLLSLSLRPDKKLQGSIALIPNTQPACYLFIPNTFMNLSGQPIHQVMNYYKIPPKAVLVAHDELDLPPGVARLKAGGGHGGHNGLRSIIQHIGSAEFHRLRLGIGHPGHRDQVHHYVLHAPSQHDHHLIHTSIEKSLSCMPEVHLGHWSKAMQQLHTPASST